MRKYAFLAILISLSLLFSGMAFAEPQLNVTANASMAPAKSNISSIVNMANITFMHNSTSGLNITKIVFNYTSLANTNATSANLGVCVYNSTSLLGCNSTWIGNTINVSFNFPMPINGTDYTLFAAYNTTGANITQLGDIMSLNASLLISDNQSIITNDTSTKISNSSFPIISGTTSIRRVVVYSTASPGVVDTNVTNQTLKYVIIATNDDWFEKAVINIPTGFTFVGVRNYSYAKSDGGMVSNTSGSCSYDCANASNQINITYADGMKNLTIYFDVNTSTTPKNSTAFNSTVNGTNVAGINVTELGSQNITIMNIINNATSIRVVKGSAYINGSDYWEFNFTLNFSTAAIGKLQFKMVNWTSPLTGGQINMTNSAGNYLASMRGDYDNNTENQFNVTNDYSPEQIRGERGVYLNITAAGQQPTVALRMIIPSGVPIASDWWATYNIIFRASP